MSKSPDNLKLEDSSPKTGTYVLYQKQASLLKQADLKDIFTKLSKSV
jgi:hypothetical protein